VQLKKTAPDSPNRLASGACQSKTTRSDRLTDTAAPAAEAPAFVVVVIRRPVGLRRKNFRGDDEMTTSFARKALLGTLIAASMGIGYAIGAQPHMTASISLLQNARAELGAATPNKGGHRERAIGLIDQAITEVRAGIAFAASR
jgi:hypothetical protein